MLSIHKTTIDIEYVSNLLKEIYGSVDYLSNIAGGESSQAFGFTFENQNLIIRFNKHGSENFETDKYANEKFINIPIPKIIKINKKDDIFYCVSEEAIGTCLSEIKGEDFKKTLPDLFDVLSRIHVSDISDTSGYGKWGFSNIAVFNSWKEFLLDDQFIYSDDEMKNVLDKFYELVKFCPEDRYLVHGDFSGGNLIANNYKITGVLDWEQAMYGDFLYDIAWMSFWRQDFDYAMYYFDEYKDSNKNLKYFKERILCYQFKFGLESLSFYAYSKQIDKFQKLKERLLTMIKK